jgi:hypothetical protein
VGKLASFKHSSLLHQLVIYYFKNFMVLVSVGATFVQKLVLQLFLLIQNLKFVKVLFHFNLFICQSAINIQNIRTKRRGANLIKPRLEKLARDKHSSLLRKSVNYGHKNILGLVLGRTS